MTLSHITVYRVESWRGAGPYQDNYYSSLFEMRQHHACSDEHPAPITDGIHAMLGHEYCGFASLELLRRWFKGHKRALSRAGFNVAVYRVPPPLVRFGRRQLVFERGDLLPYEHLPIIKNGTVHKA